MRGNDMIRSIAFENWKSFKESVLFVDQLTILIGTNASGKSNALDALEFLSRVSGGTEISVALTGDGSMPPIRGDSVWASYSGGDLFGLKVKIGSQDSRTDYEYSIKIRLTPSGAELEGEELQRIKYQGNNPRSLRLFWTDEPEKDAPGIVARLYNTKSGTKRPLRRNISVLSQLDVDIELREEISTGIREVTTALKNIFILDPNPSAMRDFSRLSERLQKDGSNIAGVLRALPDDRREDVEDRLTRLAAKIPEKDITRVWTEFVGRHKSDAMLYCSESWKEGHEFEVDARGMSDGTLRFIAVIGALLVRPVSSTIVIEEIDNGLHPSRALWLLNAIGDLSRERKIDLLITTHNVALLDSLPPALIRSVSVATRSEIDGSSKITALDEIPLFARLIAEGEVGSLARDGKIERAVKAAEKNG
jgi:predicted ATPase